MKYNYISITKYLDEEREKYLKGAIELIKAEIEKQIADTIENIDATKQHNEIVLARVGVSDLSKSVEDEIYEWVESLGLCCNIVDKSWLVWRSFSESIETCPSLVVKYVRRDIGEGELE